jgi:hypothetical protein
MDGEPQPTSQAPTSTSDNGLTIDVGDQDLSEVVHEALDEWFRLTVGGNDVANRFL